MLDFSKLTQRDYLLNSFPPPNFHFLPYLLIFFGLLIFTAAIISFGYRPKNHLYRQLKGAVLKMLWTCSLVGFMLLFFRWQQLGVLAERIWLLFLFIAGIIWLVALLFYRYRIFPRRLDFYRRQLEFKKYLPTRKEK